MGDGSTEMGDFGFCDPNHAEVPSACVWVKTGFWIKNNTIHYPLFPIPYSLSPIPYPLFPKA